MKRRHFLLGSAAAAVGATVARSQTASPASSHAYAPLKIEAVEVIELHGTYTDEAGVNQQPQVNPLDVYDQLRRAPYADKPSGSKQVHTTAVYIRIHNRRRNRRSLWPHREECGDRGPGGTAPLSAR